MTEEQFLNKINKDYELASTYTELNEQKEIMDMIDNYVDTNEVADFIIDNIEVIEGNEEIKSLMKLIDNLIEERDNLNKVILTANHQLVDMLNEL